MKKIETLNIKQEKNVKGYPVWVIQNDEYRYNVSMPVKVLAEKINEIVEKVNELENIKPLKIEVCPETFAKVVIDTIHDTSQELQNKTKEYLNENRELERI